MEVFWNAIVCLTRVWQPPFPFFCDKTFEFDTQTWQTSLEHYYVYVQTYFLSQLRKMLILLIRSHCKMCPLPTIRSRVFVLFATDKHARLYCRQWAHFTKGTNEQNQHFVELRQKLERFVTKSGKSGCQTRVRQTIVGGWNIRKGIGIEIGIVLLLLIYKNIRI